MSILCAKLNRDSSYICAKSENIFLFILCAGISEIFCGVALCLTNPSQSDDCLPRPLSKSRQMTSIPATAANHQNTPARMGQRSSTLSAAQRHVISDGIRLPLSSTYIVHELALAQLNDPRPVTTVNSIPKFLRLHILASLRLVHFTPQPLDPLSHSRASYPIHPIHRRRRRASCQ